MSIWTKIFPSRAAPVENKDYTLADASALTLFGGLPTAAGISVGEATAMRQPTSGAAIRLLAGVLATTRVHLFQRDENGDRKRADDHPAEKLVAGFANPWLPASDFRRAAMAEAVIHGASYALISKIRGAPRELIPLPRSAVTRETDDSTGEPSFKVGLRGGGTRRYSYSEILEIRPWSGRSLTGDAAEAIARASTMADHAARLFKNGARPGGVLKVSGKLTNLAAKRISEAWQSAFGGENTGRTAILEEGATFESLAMKSTDAEFSTQSKAAAEDIARAYGIPPTLLGFLENATWKNPEMLALQFLQFTMLPIFEHWQGSFARCLLTAEERESHFFEFDLNGSRKPIWRRVPPHIRR